MTQTQLESAEKKQVLAPLEPPFTDDVDAMLKNYPSRDGYILKLFRTIANSPRALEKIGAAGMLDRGSPIPMREREIVILRTTAWRGCEYEWGVHITAFSQYVELSEEHICALLRPLDTSTASKLWTAQEICLIQMIDELLTTGQPQDATRDKFFSYWSQPAQLEILSLAGFYQTIAFIANTAEMGLEDWGAKFDDYGGLHLLTRSF